MSENIQYIVNDKHERVAVIIAIAESMLAEMGLTLDDHELERSRPVRTILDQLRTAGKIEI